MLLEATLMQFMAEQYGGWLIGTVMAAAPLVAELRVVRLATSVISPPAAASTLGDTAKAAHVRVQT